MMQKKQPLEASIVREFDALDGVGHLVTMVFNGADDGNACESLTEPFADGLGVFSFNGDDHATAHVEGAVHLPRFNASNALKPFKLRVSR